MASFNLIYLGELTSWAWNYERLTEADKEGAMFVRETHQEQLHRSVANDQSSQNQETVMRKTGKIRLLLARGDVLVSLPVSVGTYSTGLIQ